MGTLCNILEAYLCSAQHDRLILSEAAASEEIWQYEKKKDVLK